MLIVHNIAFIDEAHKRAWCNKPRKPVDLAGARAKKPKAPKKKQKTIPKLVDEAAVLLQKLVRMKAADENGYAKCVTCDKPEPTHWKDLQGGHFMERNRKATKLLEENLHPQCMGCNAFKMKTASGVLAYREYMVSMYGEEFVSELIQQSRQVKKYTRHEVEGLIFDFKRRIAEQEKRLAGKTETEIAA
jgi:hypothetical protein